MARYPDVRERLTEEVTTVLGQRPPTASDLLALRHACVPPYSKQILQEALRLYPPVWVMFRKALADDVVLGYSIPADARITLSPFVTHRHPDYWQEPEHFNPLRSVAHHPNAYFPFGGGARQCIGRHFAEMTAQLILVMVTQRYQLKLTTKIKPQLDAKVALRPREPICMVPLKKNSKRYSRHEIQSKKV